MLRVPGSKVDLLVLKSRGADVRVVYSPIDSLKIARANPDKKIVFFAIGFETTAPGNAMAVWQAKKQGISNFSVLVSHVLVPPAMASILESPLNRVQGFLGPGHVCTVMGYEEYEPIAERYRVPIVITGFEPLDILEGVLMTVRQLEAGTAEVQNEYPRVVKREGNPVAQSLVNSVFEVCDRKWRGVGSIPNSGYKLRDEFRAYDAERVFEVEEIDTAEPSICISGMLLIGVKKPHDCPAFAGSDGRIFGLCRKSSLRFGNPLRDRIEPFEPFDTIDDHRSGPTHNKYTDNHESKRPKVVVQASNKIPNASAQVELILHEASGFNSPHDQRNDHRNERNREVVIEFADRLDKRPTVSSHH